MVTAVPAPGKAVEKVTFFAKAKNEPESNYYPYAPKTLAPFTWNWPTGAPWVPDGEYTLLFIDGINSKRALCVCSQSALFIAENDPPPAQWNVQEIDFNG